MQPQDTTPMQLPLHGFAEVEYLAVVDDLGPVGELPNYKVTASQPRYVRASNGQEYIIKGPRITPDHPFVGVNEFVVTKLASYLGLPVLDYRILRMGDSLCFASAWMDGSTFYPQITGDIFAQCVNREAVYKLIAFDCWISNTDRHDGNLIARKPRPQKTSQDCPALVLNDHGHSMMQPKQNPQHLDARKTTRATECVRLPFLAQAIVSYDLFEHAVTAMEQLSEELIRISLREVPDAWINPDERELVAQFLLHRQSHLRDILNSDRTLFPALKEKTL